jgi:anaerobic selenocysteine-containing dehydrogenase
MEAAHQLDFFMAADVFETETTKTANLVLPLAAPTEVAGTYISCSQIINHLQPVVQPYGQAKTSWQILSTLTAEDLTLRIIEKLLATPCPLTYSGSLAGLAAGREENILHALDQAHTKKFGWAKVNGA